MTATATATPAPTATATATPAPTATATATPAPSTTCLGAPRYAEVRPTNTQYNNTPGRKPDPAHREWISGFGPYYDQLDGAGCVGGTTEQILEWAARKWRLNEIHPQGLDLLKAMAVQESDWFARIRGDFESCGAAWCYPAPNTYGADYQTFGITGVKRTSWADSWRATGTSTQTSPALAADYLGAALRAYFAGSIPWNVGTRGDINRTVGAWFCGCDNGGGDAYADRVFTTLRNRDWAQPAFRDVQCHNCLP